MIRRKNKSINQSRPISIDRSAIGHQSRENKTAKYNYQVDEVGKEHNRFEREYSRMSQRSRDDDKSREIKIEDQKNEQNWYEKYLKKEELYENKHLDVKYGSLAASRKAGKETKNHKSFRGEQCENHELQQRGMNELNMPFITDSCCYKTIRKVDPQQYHNTLLYSNKVQLSGTNRHQHQIIQPVRERQETSQSQLNAKYQQIWRSNQILKEKSFSLDNSQNITLRNIQPENSVIINTRANIIKSRRIYNEQEDRKITGMRNGREQTYCDSSFNEPTGRKNNSSIQKRASVDRAENNISPLAIARSRKAEQSIHQCIALPIPPQLSFSLPLSQPYHQLSSLRFQTDVRLRMIQDFSSKISLRIIQLTSTLDEMRGKKL